MMLLFSSYRRITLGLLCVLAVSSCGHYGDTETEKQSLLSERLSFDPLAKAAWLSVEYRKNPYDRDLVISYSRALRSIGSSLRALEVTQESMGRLSGDGLLMLEHGKNLLANGYYQDGASILKKVHRNLGDRKDVLGSLAMAMDFLKKHEEAQDLYVRALKQEPNDSVLLTNFSLSLILSGDMVRAEEVMENIQNFRHSNQARNNLGLARRWLKRKGENFENLPSREREEQESESSATEEQKEFQ